MKQAYKNALYFVLGAAVFVAVYGLAPLDVTYDGWIFNGYVETDVTQRYAGWLAYRQAEHLFPLTFSPLISWPFGDYTSLTDSIPLFEVIFKLLDPLLPEVFQFEGLLCCLNLGLQAVFAQLVLRLFLKKETQILAGSLLFCLSPVVLERMFRHTSLSFHWVILAAVLLYFTGRRGGSYTALWFGLLTVLTVWLHSYFLPMVLGFFLAYLLDALLRRRAAAAPWARALALDGGCFTAAIALCLGSMKLLGILDMGMGNTSGYGTMGMNLNALFNPVSLDTNWWVPGGGRMDWSLLLPMRALTLNNIESFNYLGAGVLASLAALCVWLALAFLRRPRKALGGLWLQLKEHLFLALFLLVCTVFAVSNVVCAFSYVVLELPVPELLLRLCNPFRASGRLFWPVNYMLLLAAVLCWPRIAAPLRKRLPTALLWAVVALQALDLSPVLLKKHRDLAEKAPYHGQAGMEAFTELMEGDELAYFLELRDDRPLCTWLLREGVANNLWLVSRDDYGVAENTGNMQQVKEQLLAGISPYESCTYVTADSELAAALADTGAFAVAAHEQWYLIRPNT